MRFFVGLAKVEIKNKYIKKFMVIEISVRIKNSAGTESTDETFHEWSDAYDFINDLWQADQERMEKGKQNES